MELSLQTDGSVSVLRVIGPVATGDPAALAEYLRVARENGAVRGIVDLSECAWLPTTIVPVLFREAEQFSAAGGSLSLCGLKGQNPFLAQLVAKGRFAHYRTADEATTVERRLSRDSETSL